MSKKNGSGQEDNVRRLPVAHRDLKVQLMEAVNGLGDLRAGILIAVDSDFKSTCISMISQDASEAHLAACVMDLEILKHRLVVLADDVRTDPHLTDSDPEGPENDDRL